MKRSKKLLLAVTAVIVALCLSVSFFNLGFFVGKRSDKLDTLRRIIRRYYALDYSDSVLTDTAAKGLVAGLGDPYSEYYSAKEYAYFDKLLDASFTGIGVTILYDTAATIVEVSPGSPAEKAGVLPGDVLFSVDGIEVTELTYEDAILHIRGLADDAPADDEPMQFIFLRGDEELSFSIARDTIDLPVAEGEFLDGNIYYLKLYDFSRDAYARFKELLDEAKTASGLILDLRDNGGGLVTSVTSIASELLPEGLLFYAIDARGERSDMTIDDNDYLDIPLVVLVNESSASASEILTGAVQDGKRGTIVGETTYGKGLMQEILPLPDGSGIKLTVAKYYTAGGRYINETGITPDVVVPLTDTGDAQLDAAIAELKK